MCGVPDITGWMEDFLGRHGFKVAVMKADAVQPERREAWVAKRIEDVVDAVVCHPAWYRRACCATRKRHPGVELTPRASI